jgi:hypothetical protein
MGGSINSINVIVAIVAPRSPKKSCPYGECMVKEMKK